MRTWCILDLWWPSWMGYCQRSSQMSMSSDVFFHGAGLHLKLFGRNEKGITLSEEVTYVLKMWMSLISVGTLIFLSLGSWQLWPHVLKPRPLLLTLDIFNFKYGAGWVFERMQLWIAKYQHVMWASGLTSKLNTHHNPTSTHHFYTSLLSILLPCRSESKTKYIFGWIPTLHGSQIQQPIWGPITQPYPCTWIPFLLLWLFLA